MPGRVMTAQQAKKEYGDKFGSIKKSGNTITLKNSSGKPVEVSKNTRVYHRGHGDFGIYSQAADVARSSKYRTRGGKRIGKGGYRQTRD